MQTPEMTELAIKAFKDIEFQFELFCNTVRDFFLKNPKLYSSVHSVKSRLKGSSNLKSKIARKSANERITHENIFKIITDLAGVRVLHLYQDQFLCIHEAIQNHVSNNDWVFHEPPKAYTWDPECVDFFKKFNLEVNTKESFYTSIHYVVKPREDSPICCEIQIRTLFEEIWAEIDHQLNYPESCKSRACREQILVLSKLIGAGSRLADSIFRTAKDFKLD